MQKLLHALGTKPADFAREVGINPTTLHNYVKGRKIKGDNAAKIVGRFPNINLNWLLTGKGEMFTNGKPPSLFQEPVVEYKASKASEAEDFQAIKAELAAVREQLQVLIRDQAKTEAELKSEVDRLQLDILRLKARLFDEGQAQPRRGPTPPDDMPDIVSVGR